MSTGITYFVFAYDIMNRCDWVIYESKYTGKKYFKGICILMTISLLFIDLHMYCFHTCWVS